MRRTSMILLAMVGCHPDPSSPPVDESAPPVMAACTFEGHPMVMKSPSFSMLVCVLDAQGAWNAIEPKAPLLPGTQMAVRMKLHRGGFLYVFAHSDVTGWSLLYPDAGVGETEHDLIAGEFQIPPMDSSSPYFRLEPRDDCSDAEEKLIAVFSEQPLPASHPLSDLVAPLRAGEVGDQAEPESGVVVADTAVESEPDGSPDTVAEPDAVANAPKSKRPAKNRPRVPPERLSTTQEFLSDLDAPPGERPLSRPRPTGSAVDVRSDDEGVATVAFSYLLVPSLGSRTEGCSNAQPSTGTEE